nr:sirohydrochlorin cobaltochelatase [Lachnospiraceae bacterium]
LVVQPTHLMHGAEYDELTDALKKYAGKFDSVSVAEPLLGEVGSDASVVNDDKKAVAEAVVREAVKEAGYASLDEAAADGMAFVLMGHGTAHTAKVSYSQMASQMKDLGYANVFVGTVEGEPEETSCENIMNSVKDAGYTKVVLRPLMVVAGDHANNDMAGDDDGSWKSMFSASGAFESVDCQIAGLGRIKEVKELYVAHTAAALSGGGLEEKEAASEGSGEALSDGVYKVVFTTDSTMFKVNDELDDMAELTAADGKMTVHITLQSDGIVNLFLGTAEDAQKDGAVLLEPTKDEVKYSDGTTETVNGFDVPVPVLDEEFDLALVGKKGKWYDHKVSVSLAK